MKIFGSIILALCLSVGAFAQTTTSKYENTTSVLDTAGNLIVFESGYAVTTAAASATTSSAFGRREVRVPRTRITVIRPSQASQTVEYNASMSPLGAGALAVYAVVISYTQSGNTLNATQSLSAILPGAGLPSTTAGFPSLAITTPADVRLGPNDRLSIVDEPARPLSTTARQVRVAHFNGSTSFDTVSTGTLP